MLCGSYGHGVSALSKGPLLSVPAESLIQGLPHSHLKEDLPNQIAIAAGASLMHDLLDLEGRLFLIEEPAEYNLGGADLDRVLCACQEEIHGQHILLQVLEVEVVDLVLE